MRLLIITDRFPMPGHPSPTDWLYRHVDALSTFAEVDIASVVRIIPRIKNLLSDKREWKWISRVRSLPRNIQLSEHVRAYFYPILAVPDSVSWDISSQQIRRRLASKILSEGEERKYDAIIVHWAHATAPLAMEVGRRLGIPTIVAANEDLTVYRRYTRRGFFAVIAILRSARYIVTQCAHHTDEIEAVMPGANVTQIPLGTNFRASYDQNPKRSIPFRIVAAARLDEKSKRIDILLEAAARVNASRPGSVNITICGSGFLMSSLQKLALKLGIGSIVTFTGWVKHEELLRQLNNFDLFILPSEAESFGIIYLEVTAAGVPVIGSSKAGVMKELSSLTGGVIALDRMDPETLSEAIINVMEHAEAFRAVLLRDMPAIEEQFSWGAHARKWRLLLESIIE